MIDVFAAYRKRRAVVDLSMTSVVRSAPAHSAVAQRRPMTIGPVLFSFLLILTTGCSQFVNPFHDEMRHVVEVTTPSVDGIRAAEAARSDRRQEYAPAIAISLDQAVTHEPLLFENLYEEVTEDDRRFEWTLEDYFHVFYWRARFLANLVALPVSLVVTPPWVVQESDGVSEPNWFGELHDARNRPSGGCRVCPAECCVNVRDPG